MKYQTAPAGVENDWKSNMDFSKLQMKYVDGHQLVINTTKKLGGGTKLYIMQLKAWKQLILGSFKEKYLKAKISVKAAYFAKKDVQAEYFASINNNSDKNQTFKWQND